MKKLFNQLMPYLNRKYYPGRGIRWMIADIRGRSVYCFCCGNIANAVGEVKLMGWLFRLPVCKAHLHSYMNARCPGGDWSIASPGVFPMNLKYRPDVFELFRQGCEWLRKQPIHWDDSRNTMLSKWEELSAPVDKFLIDPIEDEAKHKAAIFGAADVLNPLPFWCGDECDGGPEERCNRQCLGCKGEAHYMEWPHWKWRYRNVESLKK